MPDTANKIRDGISQQMRRKAALMPEYAKIDERSLRDDLEFILKYSNELRYFNENDQVDNDLSKLFSFVPQGNDKEQEQKNILDQIESFIENPDALPEDPARAYQQPHFVLLLSFLKLLEGVRERLNGLTKKHLDFYFKNVLRMQKKKAVPNHVHVLVDLAKNTKEFLLPAGTLLNAGKDSSGKYLVCKTNENVLLNRAQIEKLSATYAKKEINDIENIIGLSLKNNSIKMLILSSGNESNVKEVGEIKNLYNEIMEIKETNMSFSSFKKLINLRNSRQEHAAEEKDMRNNIKMLFSPYDPYSKDIFKGLPDISNIDELYELYQQIGKEHLEKIINSNIGTLDEERKNILLKVISYQDFNSMMNFKIIVDNEWRNIDEILQKASGKHIKYVNSPNFEDKLRDAFPKYDIKKIESLYQNIKEIENSFYVSPYDFSLVVENSDSKETCRILSAVYRRRITSDRCKEIKKLIKSDNRRGILSLVTGEQNAVLEELKRFLTELDFNYLKSVWSSANSAETDKICSILAVAWCNREGLEPVAEEKWQGIYAAEDARTVSISGATQQRWKAFGQIKEKCQRAEFGLAISSPVLLLSQGERTIILDIKFKNNEIKFLDFANDIFCFLISKKHGWMEAKYDKNKQDANKPNEIKLHISSDEEEVSAPEFGMFKNNAWPILKIIFKENLTEDIFNEKYQLIKKLLLSEIGISVDVTGLSDFSIKNDLQTLDSRKPFEPFGSRPVAGSKLYISHSEFSVKKISDITFAITWSNSENLTDDYYHSYKEENEPDKLNRESFMVEIMTDNFNERYRILQCLFDYDIKRNDAILKFSNNNKKNKEFCIELQSPDFQHTVYPLIAAKKAVEIAAGMLNPETKNDYIINPPYTPIASKLTINYTSAVETFWGNESELKLFHIYPFGYAELCHKDDAATETVNEYSFFPQFDNAGELYIGLKHLDPPQHLNMLFQVAEGSADASLPSEAVHWDYLSGNEWENLEKQGRLLHDGTNGLRHSGIIKFSLPAADQPSTILPSDLYWLRARIRKYPNSVCDILDIHTQAVPATLLDASDQPLPSGSIQKLSSPLPAVKAVQQPYPSFGGKSAEQDDWFCIRVSERLRHKQRALTQWDYEHLVLERFPQIYKVKCVRAEDANIAGTIKIVVIPNIRNYLQADPFKPKAPANLLQDIQEYLKNIAPDFASVVVTNPDYEQFSLRMGVRYSQGYDEGYCAKLLNEDINKFLAPWAYAEGADIVIGGSIYANSIINFAERLPYVDYIAQLDFFPERLRNNDDAMISISSTSNAAVLVPEAQHTFDPIPEIGYVEESFTGIGYWMIGLDFIVS